MEPDDNIQRARPDASKSNDQSMDPSTTGRPSSTRVTVQEAAEVLGITVEAVRARIKRGKLRREKGEGGTVYVWLDADQTQPDTDQTSDWSHPDTDRTRPDIDQTGKRIEAQADLVDSLLDQVAYMREQLAEEREARRRADTIIAQLTQANATLAQRVPELEAPPDTRESPVPDSEESERGTARAEQEEPFREGRPSWLKRFFGLE